MAWETFNKLKKSLQDNGLDRNSPVSSLVNSSSFQPDAGNILLSSAETAVSNLTFLCNLMHRCIHEELEMVPLESIAAISRVVLISSSPILYVLHPTDEGEQRDHLREVQAANFYSEDMYLKRAEKFAVLLDYKEERRPRSENPGQKITDTAMLKRAMDYVIDHVYGSDTDSIKDSTGEEKIAWMWNVWSGQAHGLYWPLMRPNRTGYVSSEIMPGEYPVELNLLTTLTWRAMETLRDACMPPTSNQQ